jgi:hypothetical protein
MWTGRQRAMDWHIHVLKAYLYKPVDPERFYAALLEWLPRVPD